MRRSLGLVLVVLGLVATVVGLTSGCGSLFSFSGRHPVASATITPGTPLVQSTPAKRDRRYTLAVQVVFEREGLTEQGGAVQLDAKFPIAASLEDTKISGWLDPAEPPSVLYGQTSNPKDVVHQELLVERLVGPVLATTDHALPYTIDLGTDRVGKARIHEARAVLYDDALPPQITVAFAAAAAGFVALMIGAVLFVSTLLGARRGVARRR